MIQQLQQIFHSIIKSLEVLYVIEGSKPCARILVFEDELEKVMNFLKDSKINAAVSDFKVLKQASQSEFYSDKSIKIPKNNKRKGYFFVYLSKGRETAEKARLTEEKGNHLELGLVLGYPKCCCEFFAKYFSGENADLTLKALENSNGYEFPFHTNIAARHFDISLLSHFPCSFECKQSIDIAKNNLNMIKKHSKPLSVMFSGILQGIVIYTMQEGIFLLRHHEKISSRIVYGDILTTAKSKLYYLLSSGRELEIIGKNSFIANNVKVEGSNYGIMIFTWNKHSPLSH